MDKIFLDELNKYKFIKKGDRLLLGVSGGPDSMYLLYNLLDLRREYDLDLLVCHLNHGIRKTALRDEKFVIDICKKYNLTYNIKHVNMNEFAKIHKMTSEEAGRFLRYEFFRELSDGRKILTAHNLNDQAETLLIRIIRGTGIKGLKGIPMANEDLLRPLVNISRKKIEKYLDENKLPYVLDETNEGVDYTRNRIRNELIPYLEENFNEGILKVLIRLNENALEERTFVEKIIAREYEKLKDGKSLIIEPLLEEDPFIGREIIKLYLESFNEDLVTRANILAIYNMLEKKSGTSIDLSKKFLARVSYGRLIIEKKENINYKSQKLDLGENLTDFGIVSLKNVPLNELNKMDIKANPRSIFIDKDKISGPLYIRSRQDGDRFRPLGMDKDKKLKDFFIDKKLDRLLRDKIGLICDDNKIIWIIGYGISDIYKIRNNSKHILNLEVKNGNG
ncbi:tRNA lysidine(34) synthetase TilS [uncultured Peptoniphilus sp.]|uniref:tRNA lysidine(34) synthetase TilS n=1 Tax=uncultured Peptoniphilus sp. TaxID=254354 RepID=UPI002803A6A6|nr:tRNA lysidine(34) synthetase TilS [uncultured Peptoniphilus sp.]